MENSLPLSNNTAVFVHVTRWNNLPFRPVAHFSCCVTCTFTSTLQQSIAFSAHRCLSFCRKSAAKKYLKCYFVFVFITISGHNFSHPKIRLNSPARSEFLFSFVVRHVELVKNEEPIYDPHRGLVSCSSECESAVWKVAWLRFLRDNFWFEKDGPFLLEISKRYFAQKLTFGHKDGCIQYLNPIEWFVQQLH